MDDMLPGFEAIEVVAPLPTRIRTMHTAYGATQGERCQTCVHLQRHRQAHTWLKCDLTVQTAGEATDWRAFWPACGRWQHARVD